MEWDNVSSLSDYLHFLCVKYLDQHAPEGLTAEQCRMLGYLCMNKENSYSPCQLEKSFKKSKATISGILSRLEEKGYITLELNPKDNRSRLIVLQPVAFDVAHILHDNFQNMITCVEQGFSEEEKAVFYQYLKRAIENVKGEIVS